MAEFLIEKCEEYCKVVEANSGRIDFICPICNQSHSVSEAIVDHPIMIRELIYDVMNPPKAPYYSYRYDEYCWRSLNSCLETINHWHSYYLVFIVAFLILCGINLVQLIISGSVDWISTIIGVLCGILCLKIRRISNKYKANININIDFDEALKNNAVVCYSIVSAIASTRKVRCIKKEK